MTVLSFYLPSIYGAKENILRNVKLTTQVVSLDMMIFNPSLLLFPVKCCLYYICVYIRAALLITKKRSTRLINVFSSSI